jgi:hypothetical protein
MPSIVHDLPMGVSNSETQFTLRPTLTWPSVPSVQQRFGHAPQDLSCDALWLLHHSVGLTVALLVPDAVFGRPGLRFAGVRPDV